MKAIIKECDLHPELNFDDIKTASSKRYEIEKDAKKKRLS